MYNTITQRATVGEMVLEIGLDIHALNPREYSDPISRMLCFHSRYDLGDDLDYRVDDYDGWYEVKKAIEEDENVVVIKPVYLFDHSGITISTTPFSCRWDSGQVGWVWITKESIEENYGECNEENTEKAVSMMMTEIEEYDDYIRGDVYEYTLYEKVTCECCKHVDMEHIDGCSGFYGYTNLIENIKHYLSEDWHHLLEELEDVF